MSRHVRPYIKRTFGKIITETPYNAEWVNAIKSVIPTSGRSYMNEGMWSISPQYYAAVVEITNHFFGTLIDDVGGVQEPQDGSWKERWESFKVRGSQGWTNTENRKPARRTASSTAYATLYVTADAPPEVIKAAYRALSAKYHPDKPGGSTEIMASINGAFDELKKKGAVE